MKVTVIKPAFYDGSLLNVGQEINVPETLKGSWFVPSETAKPVKPKPTKEAPRALSEMGKDQSKTFVQAHAGQSDLA